MYTDVLSLFFLPAVKITCVRRSILRVNAARRSLVRISRGGDMIFVLVFLQWSIHSEARRHPLQLSRQHGLLALRLGLGLLAQDCKLRRSVSKRPPTPARHDLPLLNNFPLGDLGMTSTTLTPPFNRLCPLTLPSTHSLTAPAGSFCFFPSCEMTT